MKHSSHYIFAQRKPFNLSTIDKIASSWRAVRYAIWVAPIIAGFPWRAVRYAIWVEKTIVPINPRAVRYTKWNPSSRIENHMAYLTARLNQSIQQFLPICSPYGTAQKHNKHPIIARAVRYTIWVEKTIVPINPRAVRYAIWVAAIIAGIPQRAVRYAIWILDFDVMYASMLHQHEFTTINQTQ